MIHNPDCVISGFVLQQNMFSQVSRVSLYCTWYYTTTDHLPGSQIIVDLQHRFSVPSVCQTAKASQGGAATGWCIRYATRTMMWNIVTFQVFWKEKAGLQFASIMTLHDKHQDFSLYRFVKLIYVHLHGITHYRIYVYTYISSRATECNHEQ